MTREEANVRIGTEEWSSGTLLKTSAVIFFENIPLWLLLCAAVYIPATLLLQYGILQIPEGDLASIFELMSEGTVEAIAQIDWTPYALVLLMQLAMTLICSIQLVGVSIFVDDWLQPSKKEPGFGKLMKRALPRWPHALLFQLICYGLLILLSCLCVLVIIMSSFLMPVLLIGGVVIYYLGICICSIRPVSGGKTLKKTFEVLKYRPLRTIGAVLLFVIAQYAVTFLLNSLTSSIFFLPDQPALMMMAGAILSAVGSLAGVFMAIGITLIYINGEQLQLASAAPIFPMQPSRPKEEENRTDPPELNGPQL